jgi:Zn-dependent peptidase ImmA (M78 family)/DNA-binding XRE family transcriptional regulator
MALGERLKLARNGIGLTQGQVAEATGLGPSTLSEFESNTREPKLAQLKRLADAYRRPLDYFLAESEPPREVVLWRERPSSPKAEELQCRLLTLAHQYHKVEMLCEERRAHELPRFESGVEEFDRSDAIRLAHDFRGKMGLGDRPGPVLLTVLEEHCRIKVFHIAFEPHGSAACTIHPESGASILLNANHDRQQRNSDLAHELFHLLTWDAFRKGDPSTETTAPAHEETLANLFAASLLIPEETLRIAVDSVRGTRTDLGLDDFFDIARHFDVTTEMLLVRMQCVFHVPAESILAAIELVKEQAKYRELREAEPQPPERPARFCSLADRAFRKALISTGVYAESVGISRREAMRRLDQGPLRDAEVEICDS